nr:immunoglobulin heavy chain junction region [Mus musculus]NSM06356.1 immunoglobulin heavy chain junction region [Mus musculus]
CTRILWYMDYW